MQISQFQNLIARRYYNRDSARGVPATFMWFVEEIVGLATAPASNDEQNKAEEFADVFTWLCTIANITGVDIENACNRKYSHNNSKGFK